MSHREVSNAGAMGRQHLLRLLVEQFDRTFTTEGHAEVLRRVTELLEHMDEDALRAYAYQHGIRSEDELEPEPGGDASRGDGS